MQTKSDGGPADYYDFPKGINTLNDWLEYMGDHTWKGDSFHLGNIAKLIARWGRKAGTTCEYDARKMIYTGCRLLMKYAGKHELRMTLSRILEDKQFR